MRALFLALCAVLAVALARGASDGAKGPKKSGKGGRKKANDDDHDDNKYYDIYEAIATLNELAPEHRTFYDLLGVAPEASDDDVSRAFRRTTVQYHPDKLGAAADARTERMSRLVQAVGSLLRTAEGRARYDWVLNDAPPWHRQAVYYAVRKGSRRTAQVPLRGALVGLALAAVVFPFLGAWVAWLLACSRHRAARALVASMAERDVRRLRGRLAGVAEGSLSPLMLEPSMVAIATADGPSPPLPDCLGLWPLRVLLMPVRLMRSSPLNTNAHRKDD